MEIYPGSSKSFPFEEDKLAGASTRGGEAGLLAFFLVLSEIGWNDAGMKLHIQSLLG